MPRVAAPCSCRVRKCKGHLARNVFVTHVGFRILHLSQYNMIYQFVVRLHVAHHHRTKMVRLVIMDALSLAAICRREDSYLFQSHIDMGSHTRGVGSAGPPTTA